MKLFAIILSLISTSTFASLVKTPCGLGGSLDERIQDCYSQPDFRLQKTILVTRTKTLKEVRFDYSSQLLWSDSLSNTMNHYDADRACQSSLPEVAGISDFSWRLPLEKELIEAKRGGISQWFGTFDEYGYWLLDLQTVDGDNFSNALMFNYSLNRYYANRKTEKYSVRCVARAKLLKYH
jgi:hypothetical protein